jgi:PAS domain S-box-containing protein
MINGVDTSEIGYSILTNSSDFIIISTGQSVLQFANKSVCALLQKPDAELVGTKITDIFSEIGEEIDVSFLNTINSDNPFFSSTHNYHFSGESMWIKWEGTGFFDKEEKLVQILFVGKDVSNAVKNKQEKDNVIATLAAINKAIDMNIICTITDSKGVITYANEKFCEISKYAEAELIGKTHRIVNSGYHSKEHFVDIWKTITSGSAWTGELKNKAKDGTYYWVKSVIIPIKDQRDSITGYLSLRIPIDAQKKMEEEKLTYLKTIEDMLFTVSHEIRKPIVTCQGLLQLVKDKHFSKEEEENEVIPYLLNATIELDSYSRKLNDYLEKNIKNVGQRT